MKKSIKRLITVFAVCAVSAFACMASGCSLTDKIKDKIEQARCEHEWNDGEVTKEATCMEKGELTKTCTLCEKVETEEIELAEHIAVYVQAVTPTCLEKGVTDGTVCSVCETKISGFQEIPALGHIVVKDSAVAPTCLEDGLTEGEHCSRCNEVLKAQEKVPATGHNLVILEAVEPTCLTEGKTQGVLCDKCNGAFPAQEILPKLAHIDEDNDLYCDICKSLFTDLTSCSEVELTSGVKVANKYFRCYFPTSDTYSMFSVKTGVTTSTGQEVEFYVGISQSDTTHLWVGCDPIASPDHNIPYVVGDGYIDFYLPEGLEIELTDNYCSGGVTVTVSEDWVVNVVSHGSRDGSTVFVLNVLEEN